MISEHINQTVAERRRFKEEGAEGLPYHLASSSLARETAAAFCLGGGGAGFFLENRATVLKVAGLDGDGGADRAAPVKLRGFPIISETPREAMLGNLSETTRAKSLTNDGRERSRRS